MSALKNGIRELAHEEANRLWENVKEDLISNGIHSKRQLEKRLFKKAYEFARTKLYSDDFVSATTNFVCDYIDEVILSGKEYDRPSDRKGAM